MFKNVINEILRIESHKEMQEMMGILFEKYERLSEDLLLSTKKALSTEVEGGIALSPSHAIDCIFDSVRTVKFIKGIYQAVIDLQNRFSEPIRILYAGSGPYATLIIPLLYKFDSDSIKVTVLDIHKTSIESVKKIIHHLKLNEFIEEYVVDNAITFKGHIGGYHLVVSETMDLALTKEPQVLITKNIVSMLKDNGILIPEKISLSMQRTFYAKELVFIEKVNRGEAEGVYSNEEVIDLFYIDKHSDFGFEEDFIFESENFNRGEIDEQFPDLCINTEVKIYKDEVLKKGESLLTKPHCVSSLYNIKEDSFKLRYETKKVPNWLLIQ